MIDDSGEQASGPYPRDREMSQVVEMAVERYLSDWRASLRKTAREHAGATIQHEHQTLYGAVLRDWRKKNITVSLPDGTVHVDAGILGLALIDDPDFELDEVLFLVDSPGYELRT